MRGPSLDFEQPVTERPHAQPLAHIVINARIIRSVEFDLPVGIDAVDLLAQVFPHHAGTGLSLIHI